MGNIGDELDYKIQNEPISIKQTILDMVVGTNTTYINK